MKDSCGTNISYNRVLHINHIEGIPTGKYPVDVEKDTCWKVSLKQNERNKIKILLRLREVYVIIVISNGVWGFISIQAS